MPATNGIDEVSPAEEGPSRQAVRAEKKLHSTFATQVIWLVVHVAPAPPPPTPLPQPQPLLL